MAPSFYDSTSSPSSLFTSGASQRSSSASENSLPTLAVVLGLIGVLSGLIIIAGICIYIFRGRLFPAVEPIDDEEKIHTKENIDRLNRSSCFTAFTDNGMVSYEEPVVNRPALRPFLLNPATPVRSNYKELLLPRLRHFQPLQASSDYSTATATGKRHSLPYTFGRHDVIARQHRDAAIMSTLRVSLSCPTNIGQKNASSFDATARCGTGEDEPENQIKDPQLVSEFSPFSEISCSDSSSSVYSEESNCSLSSTGSLSWDYYINDTHDDLFYKPGPLPSPATSETDSLEECFSTTDAGQQEEESSAILPANFVPLYCEPQKQLKPRTCTLYKKTSPIISDYKRQFAQSNYLCKAKSRAVLHSIKLRNARSHAARCASARTNSEIPRDIEPRSIASALSDKSLIVRNSLSRTGSTLIPESQTKMPAKTHESPIHSAKANLKKTPRSPPRQPFGVVTNILSPPKQGQSQRNTRPMTPPRSGPFLLLNGIPAGDLTSMTPQHFNLLRSPPRNPALLNTRWIPRPATPPLILTVFAKKRTVPASKYPGRRMTLTPPAGASLAELRGSIERALGLDVRALRGMVFIKDRSMFLPLVTERFYVQWVKERVRDGGVGIIEAWHL